MIVAWAFEGQSGRSNPPLHPFLRLFGPGSVLSVKDDPPVRNESPDVSPPKDFTTFMRQYQDMVFCTAVRLVNDESLAEDISQETFIKAHEHFEMLSASPSAGGWLKTVATRLCINNLQRYRRRWRFFSELRGAGDSGDASDAPEVEFAAPETFFSGIDAAERGALVQDSLARLPEHQRVPLVLYHFEDLSYEDISRQLGVSLAKVKTDILRGRAALARMLLATNQSREGMAT